MGSAFSGPSSEELLRAYGSIQLLSTLKLPTRVTTELSALEDATVQTSEPLTTIPPEEVYQQTSQLCHDIVYANASSKNIAELVHYTIEQLGDVSEEPKGMSAPKVALVANCVFHTRLLLRSLIEICSHDEMLNHLTYVPVPVADEEIQADEERAPVQLAHPLLFNLVQFLIIHAKRVNADTLYLYVEVSKLLLTVLATQLVTSPDDLDASSSATPRRQTFLELLTLDAKTQLDSYGHAIDAEGLMAVLLDHIVTRRQFTKGTDASKKPASTTSAEVPAEVRPVDVEGRGGIEPEDLPIEDTDTSPWSAFAELGKFFAFPFQEFARMILTGDTTIPLPEAPLGGFSLVVALIVLNFQNPSGAIEDNPFRRYLASLTNAAPVAASSSSEASSSSAPTAQLPALSTEGAQRKISLLRLYQSLIPRVGEDSTLVFFYMVLQVNPEFQRFLAEQTDLAKLLVPLLAPLYRPHEFTRIRVYTTLIILTILTFNEQVLQSLQAINTATPPWFKEKYIPSLPLTEFITLVLLHTTQLNLRSMRDPFLYDNCLACMGNMAAQLKGISLYTSKKLISIAKLFIQRYNLLMKRSDVKRPSPPPKNEEHSDSEPELPADLDIDKLSETLANLPAHAADADAATKATSSQDTPKAAQSTSEAGTEDADATMEMAVFLPEESTQSGIELLQHLDDTEGYIRTMIEIIDCLFRRDPKANIQIIYALVLEEVLFDGLNNHPRLDAFITQFRLSVEHFFQEVQKAECDTPQQVIDQIVKTAASFESTGSPIADLRFAFQESNASDFFTPSIWKLCMKLPMFYWNPAHISLFDAETHDPTFGGDDTSEDPPRSDV